MKEFFHFDPVTIIILLAGFIATWTTLKKDSGWHTSWIKQHDAECKEQRKANAEILTALQIGNAELKGIAKSNVDRLEKIENHVVTEPTLKAMFADVMNQFEGQRQRIEDLTAKEVRRQQRRRPAPAPRP